MPALLIVLVALVAAVSIELVRRSREGSHLDHDLRVAFEGQRLEPATIIVDRAA
jgi:hypothetical protein